MNGDKQVKKKVSDQVKKGDIFAATSPSPDCR